ncbi:hypothetical protein B0A55_09775, partial [Friedmanniomyces simplex]
TFYAGVESVAVAATETRNPGVAVPQAIRQVFWRILFIYMGSAFFFGLTCPANASGLIDGGSRALQSPMTIAIQTAGWTGGVNLINAFIFITCLSAVNSSIYIGSRTVLYMAHSGMAPRFLRWTDKRGVPVFAVLLTNAFGALSMMNVSTGASKAYSYIVNLSGVSTLWDVLNDAGEIVHIADYAARRFERHNRPLRIAVDEACWRFTNLTPEQVERIREGEPAANPVEKKCGVVDAVWADDGDAFMFGATTLIKQHKVNNERVKDHVKVFTADAIRRKLDFDADSFMLFALLSGEAADHRWLVVQLDASTESQRPLAMCDKTNFHSGGLHSSWYFDCVGGHWRCLQTFQTSKLWVTIEILQYRRRSSSTTSVACDKDGTLLSTSESFKRKTTDGEDAPAKAERKITFLANPAVEIDLGERPPEEDWSIWDGKDGSPYDPFQPVECEVLDCFLHHGLPEDAIVTTTAPTRKKRKNEDDAEDSPNAKKVKAAFTVALSGAEEVVADCTAAESPAIPKKRGKARKKDLNDAAPKKPRKKEAKAGDAPVEEPISAPPAVFRLPNISPALHVQSQAGRSDPRSSSMTDDERLARQLQQEEIAQAGGGPDSFGFHDLYDDDRDADSQPSGLPQGSVDNETSASSLFVAPLKTKPPLANVAGPAGEASRSALIDRAPAAVYRPVGETDDMARSFEPTVTARLSTVAKAPTNCSTEEGLVPGEVIASASLRELRATAFLARYPKMPPTIPTSAGAFGNAAPKITKLHEVIDLT